MKKLVVSLVAVLAAALVLLGAGPVAAHDELLSTNPADGTTLNAAPEDVVLKFAAEPIKNTSKLVATSDTGEQFALTEVTVAGSTVTAGWPSTAPAGTYKVAWRNVGSDGHPLTGTFTFSYSTLGRGPTIPDQTTGEPTAGIGVVTPAPQASPVTATGPGGIGGSLWILPAIMLILALVAAFFGWRERSKRRRNDRPNT
ncbi:MAG: copper resistance protein CopC [Actinobacteria bacterium]|nr:copper resistance protein CopC [Actinomycetota bacterium]